MPDDPDSRHDGEYGGYPPPERGTADWHVPLNDAIRAVESDVVALHDRIVALEGGGQEQEDSDGDEGAREPTPTATPDPDTGDPEPIAASSLDSIDDVWDVFDSPNRDRDEVDAVDSPRYEGDGSMRVNVPEEQFWGTAQQMSVRDTDAYPSEPDAGAEELHVRCHVYLDENFEISNPYDGVHMGKAFPGFTGKFGSGTGSGGDASDGTNGWSARGSLVTGEFVDGPPDGIVLPFYVYHADMPKDDEPGSNSGVTYAPNRGDVDDQVLERGEWHQLDRYCRMNSGERTSDGVLRQWNNGTLVFEKTDYRFAWEAPYDQIEGVWNNWYYGGGWGAPDGSGDNYGYIDDIRVWDEEVPP